MNDIHTFVISAEFLTHVTPEIFVISGGGNTYGHPDAGTIDRLEASGSTVYTTMDDGTVVVLTDGSSFEISGPL